MSPRVAANRREQYFRDRRDQILDAAIEIFGEKGLEAANVADIAHAAGIGKGTLYLYFKSKDEVLSAILAERSLMPQLAHLLGHPEAPLEETLLRMSLALISQMVEHPAALRLILSDAYRFPAQAERVYNEAALKSALLLADFLSTQVQAGRIRPLRDPLLTARAFIGMMTAYVLTEEILGGKHISPVEAEVWAREGVRLFLEGVKV